LIDSASTVDTAYIDVNALLLCVAKDSLSSSQKIETMASSSTRLLLLAAVAANLAQAQVGPQAELLPACIVRV
jgi:hypothetical protein